jgi:hypothetical protein
MDTNLLSKLCDFRAGGMAQVAEYLSSKLKALSLNCSTEKKQQKNPTWFCCFTED